MLLSGSSSIVDLQCEVGLDSVRKSALPQRAGTCHRMSRRAERDSSCDPDTMRPVRSLTSGAFNRPYVCLFVWSRTEYCRIVSFGKLAVHADGDQSSYVTVQGRRAEPRQ
jgi:hypothetical protein